MNTRCRAITTRGTRCKGFPELCGCCSCHHSACAIPLYPTLDNWPDACSIHRGATYTKRETLEELQADLQMAHRFARVSENHFDHELRVYYARLSLMYTAEVLKMNKHLCGDKTLQNMIDMLAAKFDTVPELTAYNEDFRRQLSQSHRNAARKRVYAFYFNRCEDLCDDMIWEIMNRV